MKAVALIWLCLTLRLTRPSVLCVYVCLKLHFVRMLQVRAVRASDRSHTGSRGALDPEGGTSTSPGPPAWTPYDGSALCACCRFPFTWHSTFKGEAQEYRERYNCRHCGGLICGPCSTKRRAIPRLGLMQPSRVCDKCFYKVIKTFITLLTLPP